MFKNGVLKTGIRQLDDMLGGGLPRGDFLLIGGCHGTGKTSLLKQIMKNNEKTACLYLSDDCCLDDLPSLADALCRESNNDCYIILDDLHKFKVGEEEAGFRLKVVARQFDIPVIGSVLLPRDSERRKDKRPDICGFHKGPLGLDPGVEVHADVIAGLYREARCGTAPAYENGVEKREIIVIKNRHGMTGTIDMDFDASKSVWEEAPIKHSLYKARSVRSDDADEKRVELHLHTNMTQMSGVSSAGEFIARAAGFGHKAVAVTDSCAVQAFPEAARAAERLAEKGTPIKVVYGMEAIIYDDEANLRSRAVLLARSQKGLKNLYKLVSWAHLENLRNNTPCITKEKLTELRDGLFVGCCTSGELFRAVLDEKPREMLRNIAGFYDYLEIQPDDTYRSVFENDDAAAPDRLREYNRTVVSLGEELGIPVCASGNVYFCDPEDEVFRRILMHGRGRKDADVQAPLYLRTTNEMLDAFSYLGEKKAYEVVVSNPGRIADNIDIIQPIPRGIFRPHIEGSDGELQDCVRSRAREIYGDPLPGLVSERLERELKAIVENDFSVFYVIAKRLVEDSEAHGYHAGSRGFAGSSLVAFLAGTTAVDPLPPHYVCPVCRHTEFFTDGSVGSGFDLPDKACPVCSGAMKGDGHNVPFETIAGADGNKVPDIDLVFAVEYLPAAQSLLRFTFGDDHVVSAGTVATITKKTALQFVGKYAKDHDLQLNEEETSLLARGLTGIKRSAGRHPCGLMIVPDGFEAEDFTPLQYCDGDGECKEITTHFNFCDLCNSCLKVDILGYAVCDMIRRLEEDTGVKAGDIPMNDPAVRSLFVSPDALGVTAGETGCGTGALSLPELSTPPALQILERCKPESFSDIIKISGLSHGDGVWFDNARKLIEEGVCTLKDVAAARDDIMIYLMEKGLDKETAFGIMEITRKGRAGQLLTDELVTRMRDKNIPEWYIDSLKKIRYMFPKAHTAAAVINAVRLGWYKLYYPKEYYNTCFSIRREHMNEEEAAAIAKEARCRGVDIDFA